MTASAFDPTTVGFAPSHDEGCKRLATDDIELIGFISSASNGTMLVRLGEVADQLYGIYKPGQHERPLWDFPGQLYLREVAAFEVSEFLGWGLVPPTVLRDGPRGPGSLQLFVPHDPSVHYFTMLESGSRLHDDQLALLSMFDMVTNNADRKGGHVLCSTHDERLYGIDNGLTFHVEPKLRTVVWDLPHLPYDADRKQDLRRLARAVIEDGPLGDRLHELLTISEVAMLGVRAAEVAEMAAMPDIDPDERWYPWPPI